MPEQARVLRVVVSSPADVRAEREAVPAVLAQLNKTIARDRGVVLQDVMWETASYPGFHEDGPQGLIGPLIRVAECDILIGIFWKRFGTPTTHYGSGTEQEIHEAYEAWKEKRSPQIMVYFNQKKHTPKTVEETDEWGRVLKFREKFPDKGLFWEYNGKAQFKELLRTQLTNFLLEMHPTGGGAAATAKPDRQTDYFAVQKRLIADSGRDFAGRAETLADLDEFVRGNDRGYFIVRGGPGQGKTSLSSHLIQTRGYTHHLVSRTGGRTDTRLILRSLLSQILTPGEVASLPESASELTKRFEEALAGAAEKRPPVVIVVDALDELPPGAGEEAYLITEALPEGSFFIVTCRPGERVERLRERLFAVPNRVHDLGPLKLAEVAEVLRSRRRQVSDDEVERIAEASQGNPLYLRAVADQLSLNPAFDLRELPENIEGFFRRSTSQLETGSEVLRTVLALLSVARAPLSIRELSRIAGRSQREVDEQGIRPVRQFLIEAGGGYTYYHMKFHEFVTGNLLYGDELAAAHRAIAEWLQRPECASSRYRLASLAYHLFEAGACEKLLSVVNPEFLGEKVRRFGYAVLEDVELCTRALLGSGDPAVVERCVAMVEGLREIVGGDIIHAAARSAQGYRAGPASYRTKLIEPRLECVPGLGVYAGILPKADIPADFLEVVPKDGRLAVAIGDVPSIGLKSAFAARFVGNLFRRFVEGGEVSDLAALVSKMNAAISGHEFFRRITAQCLEFDLERGVFHLVNAGHPYPVHYSARRRKCDVLLAGGGLLHDYVTDMAAAPMWEQYSVEMEPGDLIVLVSDGLTEGQLASGDPYGYRFTGVVEANAGQSPRLVGQAILDGWKAHSRQEDSVDDVSVIVIGVGAKGSR